MTGCDINESVLVRSLRRPRSALHRSLGVRNAAAFAAGCSVLFHPERPSVNHRCASGRTARTLDSTFKFSEHGLIRST